MLTFSLLIRAGQLMLLLAFPTDEVLALTLMVLLGETLIHGNYAFLLKWLSEASLQNIRESAGFLHPRLNINVAVAVLLGLNLALVEVMIHINPYTAMIVATLICAHFICVAYSTEYLYRNRNK